MGPIEKKIGEYMLSDGLSEETQMVLASLMKEVRPIEFGISIHLTINNIPLVDRLVN